MNWWQEILIVILGIPVLWGCSYVVAHGIGYGFITGKMYVLGLHFLKNAKPKQEIPNQKDD